MLSRLSADARDHVLGYLDWLPDVWCLARCCRAWYEQWWQAHAVQAPADGPPASQTMRHLSIAHIQGRNDRLYRLGLWASSDLRSVVLRGWDVDPMSRQLLRFVLKDLCGAQLHSLHLQSGTIEAEESHWLARCIHRAGGALRVVRLEMDVPRDVVAALAGIPTLRYLRLPMESLLRTSHMPMARSMDIDVVHVIQSRNEEVIFWNRALAEGSPLRELELSVNQNSITYRPSPIEGKVRLTRVNLVLNVVGREDAYATDLAWSSPVLLFFGMDAVLRCLPPGTGCLNVFECIGGQMKARHWRSVLCSVDQVYYDGGPAPPQIRLHVAPDPDVRLDVEGCIPAALRGVTRVM